MATIVIFDNFDTPKAGTYAEIATKYLLQHNSKCYVKKSSFNKFSEKIHHPNLHLLEDNSIAQNADFVITFGGDGTMLAAVKSYIDKNIPIMGFNVGKLGFLAEFSVENLLADIDKLMNAEYKIQERNMLQTQYSSHIITALNDFVIEKTGATKMITLKVFSNEHYIGDYRADGLIISTPTGSTAYSLSSGGPILHPNTSVFCITPICPHSLTLRPLVLSNEKDITLKIFSPSGKAIMSADGHSHQIINSGETIIFSLSNRKAKILTPDNSNFYSLMRKKLFWAEYAFEDNAE